jgi:hypothetical protein
MTSVVPEEPLLAGDRQRQNRVAKARNPLQRGASKSVCRELTSVVLAGLGERMYRLRMNRCEQAYRPRIWTLFRQDPTIDCNLD